MVSQKTLKLYVYVDGVNDVPFYGDLSGEFERFILENGEIFTTSNGFEFNVRHTNEQIELGSFRYDAKRMGAVPTITCTLMYEACLDNFWSDLVYAEFNGEKYYLKQTPTSSKSNEDSRYKHEIELVSERIILDNTYYYDAVIGEPLENDKPVTNSTKFNFFGDIEDFVKKMNMSLQYTKLQKVEEDGSISGYRVILDEGMVSDEKYIGFDDAVFSQAIQECYKTFGIPFYFNGKEIHIGFTDNAITEPLEYGVDNELLSVTKTNSNFKVVNRASGTGSEENIPYFYPNNSPKGEIIAETNSDEIQASILDYEVFSNGMKIDESLTYGKTPSLEITKVTNIVRREIASGELFGIVVFNYLGYQDKYAVYLLSDKETKVRIKLNPAYSIVRYRNEESEVGEPYEPIKITTRLYCDGKEIAKVNSMEQEEKYFEFDVPVGETKIDVNIFYDCSYSSHYAEFRGEFGLIYELDDLANIDGWYQGEKRIDPQNVGLSIQGVPQNGDTITQRLVKKVNTSSTLQPSIYRATDGKERFYNAINYPFRYTSGYELKYGEYLKNGEVHNDVYKKDDGTYYEFVTPYIEGHPREHVFTVDDIKPSIVGMTNNISWIEKDKDGNDQTVFQRVDMFSEFAYDEDDNDDTYIADDGSINFKHPYFFAKLRKLPFNLFEHASENGPMTISMTSGHTGACNFEIGVTEDEPQYNPVQIYEEDTTDNKGIFHPKGSLKRDEEGRVLCGLEDFQPVVPMQPIQQDTVNNEVWIALKKEEDTYGILMPKAPVNGIGGHRPVACSSERSNDGDTFVITNITLPDEYILKAEKQLEKAIVKYIWENNTEKFNFSVNFSRIFLEENPNFLAQLNENARLIVRYNEQDYLLYVSSFSYQMNSGDVLPNITIELDNTLTMAESSLQQAINQVKAEVGDKISALDVAALGAKYFLRKDVDDSCESRPTFKRGLSFGYGGEVEIMNDGGAKLYIDYLEVKKKATFTSLEIQEKSHVGGQILITPASMVCNNVEELEDAYRCYFETSGEGGEEIYNQFAIGDQAISQTFNEWGGHYYWRLVTGIGDDYIDLSKTDCASESDVPKAGDKIIQLGNREDKARQAAQVLSSHGDNAPSFIMYNGIDSYTLEGKNITGIIWNPDKQEPQMYSYGDFFFGDRNLENDFITFQKKEGDDRKKLHINADVTIGANSSGLENLSEWNSKQIAIDAAQREAEAAKEATSVVSASVTNLTTTVSTLESNVNKSIQEINQKLDGVVESYFDDYIPSRTNLPASEWVANGTEADHIGDTFTNTALEGDGAGQSWRWLLQDDGTYDWQQIADSDAAKALALAGQAQATADGKSTTFLRKPTNYGVGDIWIVGEDYIPSGYEIGDILNSNSKSESYYDQHWSKNVRYTDNARAEEIKAELETTISSTNNALTQSIEQAKRDAEGYTDEAKAILQEAIEEVESSKANLNDVYTKSQADGKISSAEQDAINQAKAYANAQNELLQTTLKAYADGVADQAELEAIAEAQRKVDDAKRQLDEAIEEVAISVEGVAEDLLEAKKVADEAQATLNDWASDEVISPTEKQGLKTEVAYIEGDYNETYKRYQKYIQEFDVFILEDGKEYITSDGFVFNIEVANTNWESYKNAYKAYKEDLEDKINYEGSVEIGDLSTLQTNFYSSRTQILEDISLAIKVEADYAKNSADEALTAANEAKQRITDIDYLSNTFGRALDMTGVIMSDMVSVKNDQEEIEAFLNGSDFARSDDYGKLILAAGIEDGSSDFETRAKNATTRIYEDGTIDTRWLLADYGRVGPFHIDSTKFKANRTYGTSSRKAMMVLSKHNNETGIGFTASNTSNSSKFTFSVGDQDKVFGYDYNDDDFEKIGSSNLWYYDSCVNIDLVTNKTDTSHTDENGKNYTDKQSARRINAQNSSGKAIAAIRCPHGFYEGLRPKTTFYKFSSADVGRPGGIRYNLTEYDYNLIVQCNDNLSTNLYLPDNPQDGQYYNIWKYGWGTTYLEAKHKITRIGVLDYPVGSNGYAECGIDNTYVGVIMIVWNKADSNWLVFLPVKRE